MSDFSELCPLFNTGVFNEITFSNIDLDDISLSGNALYGSLWPSITMEGNFSFGRTVVVTDIFVRRFSNVNSVQVNLNFRHHSAEAVVGTVFATCTITTDLGALDYYAWMAATVTDKTFTSDELIGCSPSLGAAGSMGQYDIMIRYKEK